MVINRENENIFLCAKGNNEGYGVDVVIDAAGSTEMLKFALETVRPCGIIGKVSWGPKPIHYSLDNLLEKLLTLEGIFIHTWDV